MATTFHERVTGVGSLTDVATGLRIAGVWLCTVAETLETCPCLDALMRQVEREIRSEALEAIGGLTVPDGA